LPREKSYPYLDAMPWEKYQESVFVTTSTEDVFTDPVQRGRIEIIKRWCGSGKKILDIGGGWGGLSDELKEAGNDVTLLELPKVARKARETHSGIRVLEGSALSIPTDETFDIVIAAELIEHIIDLDKFFAEIRRVLAESGHLIVSSPNIARPRNAVELLKGEHTQGWHQSLTFEPILHIRYFTPLALLETLKRYGFKPIEFAGSETGGETVSWQGITEEEKAVIIRVIERFTPHPSFRSSIMCVLCERGK